MKFIGTKTIETDRLILRKLTVDDAYKTYENWCSSDVVDNYVLWTMHSSVDVTIKQYTKWV